MYITLKINGHDRLGGQFAWLTSQIIYAHYNKWYIRYDRNNIFEGCNHRVSHESSPFFKALFDFVDEYNQKLEVVDPDTEFIIESCDFMFMISRTTVLIGMDQFTYFKKFIYPQLSKYFTKHTKLRNYEIPFNPEITIAVHLRLDDCRNIPDYDGSIDADHFRRQLDADLPATAETHNQISARGFCNFQSPIAPGRVHEVIRILKETHPDYEVVIITNPGESLGNYSEYKHIQSDDPSLDLYILCSASVTILSRSTFALSTLAMGNAKTVYVPLWGQAVIFGLYSKFDQTGCNYFV